MTKQKKPNKNAIISDDILDRFAKEAERIDHSFYLLFELILGTGIQLNKAIQLSVYDMVRACQDTSDFHVFMGEQIPEDLKPLLRDYAKGRPLNQPFFTKANGKAITRSMASHYMDRLSKCSSTIGVSSVAIRKSWQYKKMSSACEKDRAELRHRLSLFSNEAIANRLGIDEKYVQELSKSEPNPFDLSERTGPVFSRIEKINSSINPENIPDDTYAAALSQYLDDLTISAERFLNSIKSE